MKLATHTKKRIEIVVEAPALNAVLQALSSAQVSGYTVLPAIAGRGHHGEWHRDDSFNNASNMLCVVCITSEERVDMVVEAVYAIVKRQIGILSIADVTVVRPDHF